MLGKVRFVDEDTVAVTNLQIEGTCDIDGTLTVTDGTVTAAVLTDANENEWIKFGTTASAVNEVTVTNAATGNPPTVLASGSDTNVDLAVGGKGTGKVILGLVTSAGVKLAGDQPVLDSSNNEFIKFVKTSVAVNEITLTNQAAGAAPSIAATGDDTNIDLTLTSKGTGIVNVGSTGTATASAGAATCSHQRGIVTSESLTTAQNAAYTLTVTNTKVAATDIVLCSVHNGTNTQGTCVVESVTPGSGSFVVIVRNRHATSEALNGTIKVAFAVL
jgi:hypothetical protein